MEPNPPQQDSGEVNDFLKDFNEVKRPQQNPLDIVLRFGKYKSQSVGDMLSSKDRDRIQYIKWLSENCRSEYLKEQIKLAVQLFIQQLKDKQKNK